MNTIKVEREIPLDHCVTKTEYWNLHIEDGDVVEIHYGSYINLPMDSQNDRRSFVYKNGDNRFVSEVKKVINISAIYDGRAYDRITKSIKKEIIKQYIS